jgi:hypothetical protein
MKCVILIFAAAASCAASPAFATSTMSCGSTISPTDGPRLWLAVGAASSITEARLAQGNQGFTTGQGASAPVIAQSWLDRNSLRLAIVDARGTELARLETWRRARTVYFGTLRYDGRTWRVRCSSQG